MFVKADYRSVTPGRNQVKAKKESVMKKKNMKYMAYPLLAVTLCTGTVLAGDGSDEAGFVPPPTDRQLPPPPPRTSSSAETLDACCCCPVTPMTRTEAKKPPKPPVAVIKIKH